MWVIESLYIVQMPIQFPAKPICSVAGLQISIIERCILRPIESFNMDVIAWNSCDLVCMQMPEKTIGMQRWHKEDETTMFTTSASL